MGDMISLTKAQVPRYLIGSAFYEGLADDNDEFCIPHENFKPDLNFKNAAELEHLFHTFRYWGIYKLPDEIIERLIFEPGVFSEEVILKFDAEYQLHLLHQSMVKCRLCLDKKDILSIVVLFGKEDVLDYIFRVHKYVNASFIKIVAENGHVSLLQRATDGCVKTSERKRLFKEVSSSEVASNGHLECLRFLLKEKQCTRDRDTCSAAASNGHLACLKLAREHGCIWNKKVRNTAAYFGYLDCLKYALEQGCPADLDTACIAADNGQLACLQYILDKGVKVRKRLNWHAAQGGSLACLQLLRARGAPAWDENCARLAAANDHFACLQYLLDEGCKVDSSATDGACRAGSSPCLKLLLSIGCEAASDCVYSAAGAGSVACLKLLKEQGVPIGDHELSSSHDNDWYNEIFKIHYPQSLFEAGYQVPSCALSYAVGYGDTDCVEFLCAHRLGELTANLTSNAVDSRNKMQMIGKELTKENPLSILEVLLKYNCPWDGEVCILAAEAGKVQLLAFAHERGCPWDERTCSEAAQHPGCFECLQYAHEHGCPWDTRTVRVAVHHNVESALSYALDNGCPYGADICLFAAKAASLPCLQLLHKHGCPWDERVSREAARSTYFDVFRFCVENGCPIDKATMNEYNIMLAMQ